jgi:radical SAM-linked protein
MTDERHVLRVRYRKAGRLVYLGHLDLLHTIDRCIRRSGLPFAVTNGFSPHMRIAFSAALPLGAESHCEYYDLSLTEKIDAAEAFAALEGATPPDIAPYTAAHVDPKSPALDAWLNRALWGVSLPNADAATVAAAMGRVEAAGSITYMRGKKPKSVDLSERLVEWRAQGDEKGAKLLLWTASSNTGALRPDVVVGALETTTGGVGAFSGYHIERVSQWHEDEDGVETYPL